ncbi:MAG: PqqD family protein [Bacteroidaceae bacterium]|nr:PqqD family protein [Bacteroidaceae bacterium]
MKLNLNYRLNRVAGEYMLLDTTRTRIDMNRVFSMNEPSAWLWRRIGSQEFDEPMLVDWICAEYDVSRELAAADVHNMVCLWKEYGMLL